MVKTKVRKNGSGEFTKGEQCRLIREHQGQNQTEFGQSLGVFKEYCFRLGNRQVRTQQPSLARYTRTA